MSDFLALMIPIIAIVSVFGLRAYRMHLDHRSNVMPQVDRQLIEGLQASARRLETRVAALERALLDADAGAQQSTEV
ncbi:MAG: hypothetical protein ACYCZB_12465 [Acidiphilium sp.]